MKADRKNISKITALALFWAMNIILAKWSTAGETTANATPETPESKPLANIDCTEIRHDNAAIETQGINDHLFIGCNWFY